jgi:hypothetical protein
MVSYTSGDYCDNEYNIKEEYINEQDVIETIQENNTVIFSESYRFDPDTYYLLDGRVSPI